MIDTTSTTTTTTQEFTATFRFHSAPGRVLCWWLLRTREVDEDLFECGLADRVVLDVVFLLGAFECAEQSAPGDALRGHLIVEIALMEVLELAAGEGLLNEGHGGVRVGFHLGAVVACQLGQ